MSDGCCIRLRDTWGKGRACQKIATRTYKGEPYCGTHYPPSVAARKAKSDEKEAKALVQRLAGYDDRRVGYRVREIAKRRSTTVEALLEKMESG